MILSPGISMLRPAPGLPLPKGGEGKSWAHPVVCGGRLYIRHGDALMAYDIKL